MSDLWSHSHDWDNGYAVGHKDGYKQGRASALEELLNALPDCDYVGIENLVTLAEQIRGQNEREQ